MRRLTLAELASSVAADPLDGAACSLTTDRVTTDSRQVRPGDLFWALPGERFDGHEFVAEAFAAGAVAAVVCRDFAWGEPSLNSTRPSPLPLSPRGEGRGVGGEGCVLLRVDDTRQALGRFAAWYRRSCRAKVIGVTGSVGKTSTREAIYAVLSQRYAGVRSLQNFNNEIGVPLSLLELGPEHEFAVIELGASGPDEIRQLAEIAQPQIGVITAVGAAHLDGFGSIEGVARAKAELVTALGRNGTAMLNADDFRVRTIGEAARCGVLWYGSNDGPLWLFARGHDFVAGGESSTFMCDGGRRIKLNVPGRHQMYAALAAVAVGRWFGLADRDIAAGLENFRTPAMRCQVERLGGVTWINDAYNASPLSMWAALDMLCEWPTSGRRVLVCGDMKELGPAGAEFHRRLGEEIACCHTVDFCVAVGPLSVEVAATARQCGMASESMVHCESIDKATDVLGQKLRAGDVVLVKASRAMQLERVLIGLRQPLAA